MFVVFVRAGNVGNNTFRPSLLAKELSEFGVRSFGAAGTFGAESKISRKVLVEKFENKLPFKAEVMVCDVSEINELVRTKPFGTKDIPEEGLKWEVSILSKTPRVKPKLPFEMPQGSPWQVQIFQVVNERFALSRRRRTSDKRFFYSNEVVEKILGVPATTRGWPTITTIYKSFGEK